MKRYLLLSLMAVTTITTIAAEAQTSSLDKRKAARIEIATAKLKTAQALAKTLLDSETKCVEQKAGSQILGVINSALLNLPRDLGTQPMPTRAQILANYPEIHQALEGNLAYKLVTYGRYGLANGSGMFSDQIAGIEEVLSGSTIYGRRERSSDLEEGIVKQLNATYVFTADKKVIYTDVQGKSEQGTWQIGRPYPNVSVSFSIKLDFPSRSYSLAAVQETSPFVGRMGLIFKELVKDEKIESSQPNLKQYEDLDTFPGECTAFAG